MIIQLSELHKLLSSILIKNGFEEENAELLSSILLENTLVGVASHGVNRFPALIKLVEIGHIQPNAKPTLVNAFGAWEQ